MDGPKGKVVFKAYTQKQPSLFPPTLDSFVPPNHLARLINDAIDQMDLRPLLQSYTGGGASSYHPKMLLKVLVYAYSQQIYSSRQIAKAIRENVIFMWLCGGNKPDFRTINRFRGSRLRDKTEKIFASMLELLAELKLIDLEEYFLDGTKVEANANRYSFVWRKSTEKYSKNLDTKVKELFREIDRLNQKEDDQHSGSDLLELGEDSTPITRERMEEKLAELNTILQEPTSEESKEKKKQLKKGARQLERDYIPRRKKYDKQLELFDERNSFSKTDTDATFMRMKDDHMRNGQLKPGYNIQIGTENQFITGYSIHAHPTDAPTLPNHLDTVKNSFGFTPKTVVADAGYGSEENYTYLEHENIKAFVKYGNYQHEATREYQFKKQFYPENLSYDVGGDFFTCPAGRKMKYVHSRKQRSKNNFLSDIKVYQAENCSDCDLRNCCHNSARDRRMFVNTKLIELRKKARDLLNSAEGIVYRGRRLAEVESVFGQIKHNNNFRRFLLRGIRKVKIEWALVALAHNMKKWHAKTCLVGPL